MRRGAGQRGGGCLRGVGRQHGRHRGERRQRVDHAPTHPQGGASARGAPSRGQDAVDDLRGRQLGEAFPHQRGQPGRPRRGEARAVEIASGDAAADGEGAQAAARGGHVHPRARHREPGGRVVGPDRADRQDVRAVPTGERNLVDGLIPGRRAGPDPGVARGGHDDDIRAGREPQCRLNLRALRGRLPSAQADRLRNVDHCGAGAHREHDRLGQRADVTGGARGAVGPGHRERRARLADGEHLGGGRHAFDTAVIATDGGGGEDACDGGAVAVAVGEAGATGEVVAARRAACCPDGDAGTRPCRSPRRPGPRPSPAGAPRRAAAARRPDRPDPGRCPQPAGRTGRGPASPSPARAERRTARRPAAAAVGAQRPCVGPSAGDPAGSASGGDGARYDRGRWAVNGRRHRSRGDGGRGRCGQRGGATQEDGDGDRRGRCQCPRRRSSPQVPPPVDRAAAPATALTTRAPAGTGPSPPAPRARPRRPARPPAGRPCAAGRATARVASRARWRRARRRPPPPRPAGPRRRPGLGGEPGLGDRGGEADRRREARRQRGAGGRGVGVAAGAQQQDGGGDAGERRPGPSARRRRDQRPAAASTAAAPDQPGEVAAGEVGALGQLGGRQRVGSSPVSSASSAGTTGRGRPASRIAARGSRGAATTANAATADRRRHRRGAELHPDHGRGTDDRGDARRDQRGRHHPQQQLARPPRRSRRRPRPPGAAPAPADRARRPSLPRRPAPPRPARPRGRAPLAAWGRPTAPRPASPRGHPPPPPRRRPAARPPRPRPPHRHRERAPRRRPGPAAPSSTAAATASASTAAASNRCPRSPPAAPAATASTGSSKTGAAGTGRGRAEPQQLAVEHAELAQRGGGGQRATHDARQPPRPRRPARPGSPTSSSTIGTSSATGTSDGSATSTRCRGASTVSRQNGCPVHPRGLPFPQTPTKCRGRCLASPPRSLARGRLEKLDGHGRGRDGPHRELPPPPAGELALQAPPEPEKVVPGGVLMRLLPLVMLAGSLGFIVVLGVRNPTSWLFGGMFAISTLGMMATGGGRGGAARASTIDEGRRDYLRYLDQMRRTVRGGAADAARRRGGRAPRARSVARRRSRAGGCGSAARPTPTSDTCASAAAPSGWPPA